MKESFGNVFKAASPKAETQSERTTREVRSIVSEEAALRKAKSERLRAARLARDADK
jgi:hypothetical protein